jgi:hypothetical protein
VWDVATTETRRRDGAYRQVARGWALSDAWLARIAQSRPLERLADGRYAPAGDWTPESQSATAVAGLTPLRPAGGSRVGEHQGAEEPPTLDYLAALPPEVRELLGEAEVVLPVLELENGGVEVIRALSADPERVVAVRLTRDRQTGGGPGPWTFDVWRAAVAREPLDAGDRSPGLPGRSGLRGLLGGRR